MLGRIQIAVTVYVIPRLYGNTADPSTGQVPIIVKASGRILGSIQAFLGGVKPAVCSAGQITRFERLSFRPNRWLVHVLKGHVVILGGWIVNVIARLGDQCPVGKVSLLLAFGGQTAPEEEDFPVRTFSEGNYIQGTGGKISRGISSGCQINGQIVLGKKIFIRSSIMNILTFGSRYVLGTTGYLIQAGNRLNVKNGILKIYA